MKFMGEERKELDHKLLDDVANSDLATEEVQEFLLFFIAHKLVNIEMKIKDSNSGISKLNGNFDFFNALRKAAQNGG